MEFKETKLILDKKINSKTRRHYINGTNVVLHCHHYSTLYTQLAMDSEETDLLEGVAIEVFYKELVNYFKEHAIKSIEEKIEIGSQLYAAMGLGKLIVKSIGEDSGLVEIPHSHVDAGWLKKWGQSSEPVNYIGAGFCSALFSAINDNHPGAFKATEIESIAMGKDKCIFKVVKG